MKRTPLGKGNKRLQQKKPLKANKKLAPRSKKAQKLYAEKRKPLVEKLLIERPWCEACLVFAEHDGLVGVRVRKSRDLHEIKTRGRTGGISSEEWLQEDNILCVCRQCHTRITDNPAEALELGLVKKRNDK